MVVDVFAKPREVLQVSYKVHTKYVTYVADSYFIRGVNN